jgi:NAD(P)-dependent dehydrogenase (short-subunit alcohol dehydrogenase family)
MHVKSQPLTIVITGVTRGLGRAMVDEFVRLGHRVLGCARTKHEIDLLKHTYPEHDFQVADVAADADVRTWATRVLSMVGPPDFVINNAAVLNCKAPLWEVDANECSDAIDINVKGVVNVVRHFAPPMIGRGHGVIVNLCSRWGIHSEQYMAPYCATKWAVVALTRVLAEEMRSHNIVVAGLNPGIVNTPMLAKYLDGVSAPDLAQYPMPDEWAKYAVPYILRFRMRDTGKLRRVPGPQQTRAGFHEGSRQVGGRSKTSNTTP